LYLQFHREVITECSLLRHTAQSLLISERAHQLNPNTVLPDDSQGVIVFNTLPWTRSEVIVSPEKKTKWANQQYKGDYEYLLGKKKKKKKKKKN
jgi:alpha-mannosidase